MNYYDLLNGRTSKRIRIYKHINKLHLYNKSPVSLEIFPSNLCNLACNFCSYKNMRDESSLNVNVFSKLIDSIIELGINSVVFSGGGEPTMNPYLPIAIKKLYSGNVDVGIITNGFKYTEKMLDAFQKCSWIRFSINATNGNDYEKITGMSQTVFENIKNNISMISEKLKEYYVVIGISVLISTHEHEDVESVFYAAINLASELGVNQIFFKPLLNKFEIAEKKQLCKEKILKICEYASQKGIITNIKKFYSEEKSAFSQRKECSICKVVRYNLVGLVTSDGKLYPCLYQFINYPDNYIGDIVNENLSSVYMKNNKAWINSLRRIERGECHQCRYCNLLSEIYKYEKTKEIKTCCDQHFNFL